MPWKVSTPVSQRREFVRLAQAGAGGCTNIDKGRQRS